MSVRASAARRLVKRAARSVWAGGHRILMGGRRRPLSAGVRILTYHRVAGDAEDPFCVSPDSFRRQMEALAETGRAEPLDSALVGLVARTDGESRIVITVDDGTEDFVREALPILVRLRLPATLYVSPQRVGAPGFLDWAQLKEVVDAGVSVGSHGLDHRSLALMTIREAEQQSSDSKRILEDRLGAEVTSLAYPYGTYRDFNGDVKEAIRRTGYRAACTSVNGVNRAGADLLELRRTKIEQGDDRIFPWILAGCLDGWYVVDRYLAFLQNRYAGE